MDNDKKFLETLLDMLVSEPKMVKVERIVNERGVLLQVDVAPEDLGTMIGKQGHNIQALRDIVRILGLKNKSFVSIKLNQDQKNKII
ncbi:MAG: KH domain-containing protein [Candidatus Parcubacteria bacterium]|nr:KH domain-containing protein [Candidatus Parcubacteria bacterium]